MVPAPQEKPDVHETIAVVSEPEKLQDVDVDARLNNSEALGTSLPHPDGYFGTEKTFGGAFLPPPSTQSLR